MVFFSMGNLDKIFYFLNKVFPDKSAPLTILDIGSKDCLEAIEFSKHFINSKVYSFEPNPDAIKIARKNSKEYKNHTLIEKAVSDKNGYIKFYPIDPELTETTHKDGNIGASSIFKASGKYPIEKYVQKEIEVESITIEQFCKDNNINKIDFVWMDLQGAEYLALKGMGSYLQDIEIIHTEAELFEIYENQHFFEDIENLLTKTHFLISGNKKNYFFANFIFLKKGYFKLFLKDFIKFKKSNAKNRIRSFFKPLKS